MVVKPAPGHENDGVNIVSPYRGRTTTPLGAALTNVTFRYWPIEHVEGLIIPMEGRSAEHWYKANKTTDRAEDMQMMQKVIVAKLQQYPQLVEAIERKGGEEWLRKCHHVVFGTGWWEGKGEESPFIRVLIAAYQEVKG
jgi:hypothetical protein